MKKLLLALGCSCIMFLAWTYVYNAGFHLFIVPEDPSTPMDNITRIFQVVFGFATFVVVYACYKDIKESFNES